MNKTKKFILGIDAGSTKTKVRITDDAGHILGEGLSGSGSVSTLDISTFKTNILQAVNQAQKNTNHKIYKFDAFCFGGAGVDTPELKQKAESILKEILVADKMLVANDTQLVLPACSAKNYGIVVIAGTGSNFYGRNKNGKEAYVGGLGGLLTDEGSGYWIGRVALRSVVRAGDGRGEKTLLTDLIFKKLSIKSVRELVDVVYEKGFEQKSGVASLSQIVDEAYIKKDKVAEQILVKATQDIASSINVLVDKLQMMNDEFEVHGIGGVFRSSFPFEKKINELIEAKKAKFILCKKEPVEGAIKLAIAML